MKVNSGEITSEINRTVIFTLVKRASSRCLALQKVGMINFLTDTIGTSKAFIRQ